jgi:hypothetical protein
MLATCTRMLCVPACLRACVPACLRACVPACLRACVPACLRACVPACLHGRASCWCAPLGLRAATLRAWCQRRCVVLGLPRQYAGDVHVRAVLCAQCEHAGDVYRTELRWIFSVYPFCRGLRVWLHGVGVVHCAVASGASCASEFTSVSVGQLVDSTSPCGAWLLFASVMRPLCFAAGSLIARVAVYHDRPLPVTPASLVLIVRPRVHLDDVRQGGGLPCARRRGSRRGGPARRR